MRLYRDGFRRQVDQHWKVALVHYLAKLLGLLVHIDGMPYGSNRTVPREKGDGSKTASQMGY